MIKAAAEQEAMKERAAKKEETKSKVQLLS